MNNSYNYADFIGLNLNTASELKTAQPRIKVKTTDPTSLWADPSLDQDRKPAHQRLLDTKSL